MKFAPFAAFALFALAGCSNRNVDSTEAVKQGVLRDISKSVNIGAMDVNVVSVSFRDKEADAVVSFAPKGGSAAQGLTMKYKMERTGGEWHIKERGSMSGHGGTGAAEPPAGNGSQLPAGHPPLNGNSRP